MPSSVAWEVGRGPFATVSHCLGVTTVVWWPTLEAALDADSLLYRLGCGRRCHREHELLAAAAELGVAA